MEITSEIEINCPLCDGEGIYKNCCCGNEHKCPACEGHGVIAQEVSVEVELSELAEDLAEARYG